MEQLILTLNPDEIHCITASWEGIGSSQVRRKHNRKLDHVRWCYRSIVILRTKKMIILTRMAADVISNLFFAVGPNGAMKVMSIAHICITLLLTEAFCRSEIILLFQRNVTAAIY